MAEFEMGIATTPLPVPGEETELVLEGAWCKGGWYWVLLLPG